MKNVTITVTVNIAAANKWEGNAEYKIEVPENYFSYNPKYVNRNCADNFLPVLQEAINEYLDKNDAGKEVI